MKFYKSFGSYYLYLWHFFIQHYTILKGLHIKSLDYYGVPSVGIGQFCYE